VRPFLRLAPFFAFLEEKQSFVFAIIKNVCYTDIVKYFSDGRVRKMYDFDKITDRRNTYSLKWDVGEKELPMWVADMDFEAAPEIVRAIEQRASHGVFGYSIVPDEWYASYISHWKNRYGFVMDRQELVFCTGVVPAISSIVRKLTTPNENVLIQTPVYNIFFNSVINNGRRSLESPLCYDGKQYYIDFADLEQKLSDPQTTLMILCNPHNPVGKIWDRETLSKIGALCRKYSVTVISDEIHADLTFGGKKYVPFASVDEVCRSISITCIAPTKTFNIAGLQTAAVYVPDSNLRHKVWRALNTDEVAEPNVFAVIAAVAAYTKAESWLDELLLYVGANKRLTENYIRENIPFIKAVPSEATYLVWIDCTGLPEKKEDFCGFIRKNTGLYLSEGTQFGKGGKGFLRLNAACPRTVLVNGLERLKTAAELYLKA